MRKRIGSSQVDRVDSLSLPKSQFLNPNPFQKIIYCEQISAERARARVAEVCAALNVRSLFIDAGPLRDLSRDLAFSFNGLHAESAPPFAQSQDFIQFRTDHLPKTSDSLIWDGPRASWRGLRAAAVEFTQREGSGLRHKLARTQDGLIYPLIAANRDESIQRVINELLTLDEGVLDVTRTADGSARHMPGLLLPRRDANSPAIVATLDQHLLTGSRRFRSRDGRSLRYADDCENHLLLALAYAFLAARINGSEAQRQAASSPTHFQAADLGTARNRQLATALATRRQRRTEG